MEFYRSQELKKEWGDKPCDHPSFEKVYFSGAFLLNYSCTQCGADFTIAWKLEIDEIRKGKGAQSSEHRAQGGEQVAESKLRGDS